MTRPTLARSPDVQLAEAAAVQGPHRRAQVAPSAVKPLAPRFVVAPLVPVVAAMSVGIVLDRYIEPWGTRKWVGLTLLLAAFAVFLARRRLTSAALVLVAIAATGGAWHHYRYSDMDADDLALRVTTTGHPAWVRGVVREALGMRVSEGTGFAAAGSLPASTRFVLDLTEISDGRKWHRASGRAVAIVTGDRSEILAGEAVEAAGEIALLAPPLNPGEFDYRAFLRVEGIRLRLTVGEARSFWRRPGESRFRVRRLVGQIRAWSRARLFERLEPSVSPLALALLLGQREGIEPEVNDAFARTGTTHLLAISGLQLQALAWALLLVFRVVGLRRRPAYLAVAGAIIGYAVVVGPAPSVVRATVMTATFCLAAISGRRHRPANTLALAALGTLAINPSYLFDVGCQLSFLAIGALIWLRRRPPATLARACSRCAAGCWDRRRRWMSWRGSTSPNGVAWCGASRVGFDRRPGYLGRRLARGAAAGGHAVSPGLANRRAAEHPPHTIYDGCDDAGGPELGAVNRLGATRRPVCLGGGRLAQGDQTHRSLGGRRLGASLRGGAGMRLGAGLLCLAGPGGGGSDTTDLIRQAHRVAAPQGGSVVAAGRVGAAGLAAGGAARAAETDDERRLSLRRPWPGGGDPHARRPGLSVRLRADG